MMLPRAMKILIFKSQTFESRKTDKVSFMNMTSKSKQKLKNLLWVSQFQIFLFFRPEVFIWLTELR